MVVITVGGLLISEFRYVETAEPARIWWPRRCARGYAAI